MTSGAPPVPAPGDDGLPEFERPPVHEVALGVSFTPLVGLRAVQLGALWERWRGDYPVIEEQPPLPPATAPPGGGIAVMFGPPPVNRHWFFNETGDHLVQLQADRLVVNWRQTVSGQNYPRYRVLREELAARMTDVEELSRRGGWGELAVTDAELTYVNLVLDGEGRPARAEDVLAALTTPIGHQATGSLTETRLSQTFLAGKGEHALALQVTSAPGLDTQGGQALVLTLSVRGTVPAGSWSASLDLLDRAHQHLVSCFSSITRPAMHELWGKTR